MIGGKCLVYFHCLYHSNQVINEDLNKIKEQAEADKLQVSANNINIKQNFLADSFNPQYVITVNLEMISKGKRMPTNEIDLADFIERRLNYYCRKLDLQLSYIDNLEVINEKDECKTFILSPNKIKGNIINGHEVTFEGEKYLVIDAKFNDEIDDGVLAKKVDENLSNNIQDELLDDIENQPEEKLGKKRRIFILDDLEK
ncbi:MAG: hypothetical protein ACOCP8_01405 [archaeon]